MCWLGVALAACRVVGKAAALGMVADEIDACADLASQVIDAAGDMLQERVQELAGLWSPDAAGGGRPAKLRLGKHRVQSGLCVVVEPTELLDRAGPVEDVRFIPQFPIPLADCRQPIALTAVGCQIANQLQPAPIFSRRVTPSAMAWIVIGCARRGRSQRLGREPQLHKRDQSKCYVAVQNLIDQCPGVGWVSILVLGVHIGRAPLQFGRSVSGAEEKVATDKVGSVGHLRQLGQQGMAVWPVRVVWLVIADIAPDAS